ncbi:MAG: PadR family transcriptional regulator [Spirochaetaceae bacterium]|nr:PadR family transcriptional regulator [Spirochaetaceae bacterium]
MDMENELFEKWKSQFRKGFLELCILELLGGQGRSYGLEMMESLKAAGIEVSEGTLYPLLMRMTKDGSIASVWETPDVGHPRKYYAVTPAGSALLVEMRKEYDRSEQARICLRTKERL